MTENRNSDEDDVLIDLSPWMKQYKDGRIERGFGVDYCFAASLVTEIKSKDVSIKFRDVKLATRLYLPKDPDPENKHPVVVYFHGGNFVSKSAFSAHYHDYLTNQVKHTNAVTISVDYRRAPEHPLPTAYEDSWRVLKWVAATKQEWIREYADLNNVFLGGDNAGGNIVHRMVMRFGDEKIEGINLCGMFLDCPLFWGKEAIGNEGNEEKSSDKGFYDRLWPYVYPTVEDLDHPCINPAMDPKLSSLVCKRVLVCVDENEYLKERATYYKEALEKSGWDGQVEVVEMELNLYTPNWEMCRKVASFINQTD